MPICLASSLFLSGCGVLLGTATVGTIGVLHDRRSAGRITDDRTLEFAITRAFLNDKYITDYSHLNIVTFNGVALVTGEASSKDVREKIINIAKKTEGLKRLEHDIVIGPKSSLNSRGNDSLITGLVKSAIVTNVKIEGFDGFMTNVSTERGNVYIMGLVTRKEASAIVETARRVKGVKSVTHVFEYID